METTFEGFLASRWGPKLQIHSCGGQSEEEKKYYHRSKG
ncbi:hypothetical protein COLO4_08878 [Corchorus olitorius]|uniref:Uncharacterized protein n=1 Tax=Corchorus olitorius TaxID=93759 RepID=A0A1R3KE76_9ROSI|nr:hypothetical protein COLO4_08878 [Corchorus olitorius]